MKEYKRIKRFLVFIFCISAIFYSIGILVFANQQAEIPDELLEFAEKYPEAKDYVQAYPEKKDIVYEINIKEEVEKGTIPQFIQWDERWGYHQYGGGFFGVNGCGPTCLSMVVCGLTGNDKWDPYAVAKFSEKEGYYIPNEGTSWELMTEGAEKLELTATYGWIDENYIRENLTKEIPMICSVYPGDFTYTGHFIVLTGIDAEGNIIVNDPNSKKNSEKHWGIQELLPQIRSIWIYGNKSEEE